MVNILGIKISDLKKKELLERINYFLNSNKSNYLVTPNPEIILTAQEDKELFKILNEADLAPADGFGLLLASALQGKRINRFSGSDLTPVIISLAEEKKFKVFIANFKHGLSSSSDIEKMLKKNYPALEFLILDIERNKELNREDFLRVSDFSPQIMFCSLGSPFQEYFIYNNFRKINSLKLSLGIGGSFDFLTKKTTRSPLFFRRLGLEWLWRLVLQPKRIKRIYNATVVFSFKVVFNLFKR